MHTDTALDALLADRDRGATALARDLLAIAIEAPDPTAALTLVRTFTRERPGFAYPHRLARILERAAAESLETQPLRALLGAERDRLDAAVPVIASAAARRLPVGGTIVTLSTSECVRATLLAAHALGRRPQVLVGESRPRGEGRTLAAALAAASVSVTLVVDAALPGLLDQRSTVLLGADRLTEAEVVCKVGAYGVALAASRVRRPTIVVTDTTKILPSMLAPVDLDEHEPEELGAAIGGVRARNAYLERVPLRLVSRIVTEKGVWTRGEVRRHALRLPRVWKRGTI